MIFAKSFFLLFVINQVSFAEINPTVFVGTVNDWKYYHVTVDLREQELSIADRTGGAMLDQMIPKNALIVLNGGYFDTKYKPTDWVRDRNHELAKPGTKKNGGVIAVRGENAFIGVRSRIPFKPEFVIHNGPLLVEPGGVFGMRADDGKRAPRTVVCLTKDAHKVEFILIASSVRNGPTLYEFANILKKPKKLGGFECDSALNLDGGPSTGIWFHKSLKLESYLPPVPIGYGIAISLKNKSKVK